MASTGMNFSRTSLSLSLLLFAFCIVYIKSVIRSERDQFLLSLGGNTTKCDTASLLSLRNNAIVEQQGIDIGLGKNDPDEVAHDDEGGDDTEKENLLHNFQQNWPSLKNTMCPNMQPNDDIFLTLFELARMELGFADHRISLPDKNFIKRLKGKQFNINTKSDADAVFFHKFYKTYLGGIGYSYFPTSSDDSTSKEKQHMVYLRIYKGGNNQIRQNLDALLNQGDNVPQNSTFWAVDKPSEPITKLFSPFKIPTSQLFFPLDKSSQNDSKESSPVCILTAVRDPVEHFLSAYNEIENRAIKRKENHSKPPYYAWTEEENPLLFTRFKPGTTARFEQFVIDLIGGPGSAGFYPDEKELKHVFSMVGILWGLRRFGECHYRKNLKNKYSDSDGKSLTPTYPRLSGYLPSVHNLDADFPKLIMDTCQGFQPQLSSFNKTSHHGSSDDMYGTYEAAKSVWKGGGPIARALCAIRAVDYACYDKIPVPEVCQMVYGSDEFGERVLLAGNKSETTSFTDVASSEDDCKDVYPS